MWPTSHSFFSLLLGSLWADFSNFRLKLFAVVILAVVLYAGREVSAYYIKPETPMVWSLVSTIGMRVVAAFVYLKVIEYDD